jgi:hypothetical protein
MRATVVRRRHPELLGGGGPQHQGKQIEQRALPGAARSGDAVEAALLERQLRHAQLERAAALFAPLDQIVDLDQGHGLAMGR